MGSAVRAAIRAPVRVAAGRHSIVAFTMPAATHPRPTAGAPTGSSSGSVTPSHATPLSTVATTIVPGMPAASR